MLFQLSYFGNTGAENNNLLFVLKMGVEGIGPTRAQVQGFYRALRLLNGLHPQISTKICNSWKDFILDFVLDSSLGILVLPTICVFIVFW